MGRREKCPRLAPCPPYPQKPGVIRETKKKRTEPRKMCYVLRRVRERKRGVFLESLVIVLYPCVRFE